MLALSLIHSLVKQSYEGMSVFPGPSWGRCFQVPTTAVCHMRIQQIWGPVWTECFKEGQISPGSHWTELCSFSNLESKPGFDSGMGLL